MKTEQKVSYHITYSTRPAVKSPRLPPMEPNNWNEEITVTGDRKALAHFRRRKQEIMDTDVLTEVCAEPKLFKITTATVRLA